MAFTLIHVAFLSGLNISWHGTRLWGLNQNVHSRSGLIEVSKFDSLHTRIHSCIQWSLAVLYTWMSTAELESAQHFLVSWYFDKYWQPQLTLQIWRTSLTRMTIWKGRLRTCKSLDPWQSLRGLRRRWSIWCWAIWHLRLWKRHGCSSRGATKFTRTLWRLFWDRCSRAGKGLGLGTVLWVFQGWI